MFIDRERLAELDAALLDAHECGEAGELITLYRQAGDLMKAADNVDAACFYYTHAYVYALESGDRAADDLRDILVGYGREAMPSV